MTFPQTWRIPAALFSLGLLAVLGGMFELGSIAAGPPETFGEFDSPQYFATPLPIVTHIGAGILFNLLAPFQFAPRLRARHPRFHRLSGRVLIAAGLLAGGSAVWMNLAFPAFGGPLKFSGVLVFGVMMIGALVLALHAILRRDLARHRAWMMRAMAIGLGSATQRLVILPLFLALGGLPDWAIGLGVWLGFGGNLLFVEYLLRRRRRPAPVAALAS